MKVITPLTIDDGIKRKAKERLLNMSAIAEAAIKEALGQREVLINEKVENCQFCGKKEEKATRDNPIGLTWLWPDELWICEECLKTQSRRIFKG